jgi:hypothetical protein
MNLAATGVDSAATLVHFATTLMHCAATLMHFATTLMHFATTLMHFATTLMHFPTSQLHLAANANLGFRGVIPRSLSCRQRRCQLQQWAASKQLRGPAPHVCQPPVPEAAGALNSPLPCVIDRCYICLAQMLPPR